jgi:glyoxylase-like metal-dependent hydrolase (beta-lactamase superfamily II)
VTLRSFAADARDWFHVAEVEPGVHLVAEPGHVLSWLVGGSDRCVLVDTGLGLADIAAAIEPVAAAPTIVVNSHVHFDHVAATSYSTTSRCTSSPRSGSSSPRATRK